jgi:hypothetical protein
VILDNALVVLLWVMALGRLPTLWRDRRQRALWGAVFALALVKTASDPPIAAHLHAPILPHLLGVIAAYCLLRFIALVTGSGNIQGQLILTTGVIATLGVLDVAAGGIDTTSGVLTSHLSPVTVAYWVVLEVYLGAVLITATVLFWTVARAAPAGLPRLGLRAIAAGTCVISVYAAAKTILIVIHGFGVPVDFAAIQPAAQAIQGSAVLLTVAGGIAPTTRRARAVASAYRSLVALRPLWKAMRDAFPEIILFTPRRAVIELAGVDDVHLRLYRRVIEIRDGMLALRDFLPPHAPPAGDPAVAEAEAIALALRRRERRAPPFERTGAWARIGPDMADEVAWLREVSAAFRKLDLTALSEDLAPTPRPSGSPR